MLRRGLGDDEPGVIAHEALASLEPVERFVHAHARSMVEQGYSSQTAIADADIPVTDVAELDQPPEEAPPEPPAEAPMMKHGGTVEMDAADCDCGFWCTDNSGTLFIQVDPISSGSCTSYRVDYGG